MKKSTASRKRVLALFAALFLVVILTVPCFATGDTYVRLNGTLFFNSNCVLSDYLDLDVIYTCLSGYYIVYSGNNEAVSAIQNDSFSVANVSYLYCYASDIDTAGSGRQILSSAAAVYEDAQFNAVDGRYVVFHDFVIVYGSDLYNFLYNCKSVLSGVTFVQYQLLGTRLTSVITDAFNGVLTGFGSGAADFFETLFVTESGSLTTFATVGLILLGVGFAIGIARWVVKKVGQ